MAQFALRWILMFDAVSCVIPGAKRPAQTQDNVQATDFPALSEDTMSEVTAIYSDMIRAQVHHRW